jgi:Tfp pilus assembly protein PilE
MKKCSKCGALAVDPNMHLCEKCGAALVNANVIIERLESEFPWFWTCSIAFVVIILSFVILAAIAIPNYLKYQTKLKNKSKQDEARTILKEIYEAETAYFATENEFRTDPEVIFFKPPLTPKYYQYKIIRADEDSFVARAWGNIDKDSKIDIWEVTEKSRTPVCIYDDVENEGEEIDPLKGLEPDSLKKQSEAPSILKGIFSAELIYNKKEGTFSANPEIIGFEPSTIPKYYQYKIIHADKDGFVARAWGNIDRDDKIDIWEVTDKARVPVCIYDDVKNEGVEIDPLEREEIDPSIKQAEARIILLEIYDAELRYFLKNRKFGADFDEMGFKFSSKPKYYQFEIIHADEYGFEVRAWGNIDKDSNIDIWMSNENARAPYCIYNDLKNEGKMINPFKPR